MTKSPLIDLQIKSRTAFAQGHAFGQTGPYVLLEGRATLRIRPEDIGAEDIYEREHIARDAEGFILTQTDVWLLIPEDPQKGNGSLLFEFVNRGNKRMLQFFNSGPAQNRPKRLEDAGNGFLMRQGFSLMVAAWQGDVLPGDGRITLDLPGYSGPPERLTQTITAEFQYEGRLQTCLPLSGKTGTRSLPVIDPQNAQLIRRRYPEAPPEAIPRDRWSFSFLEGASAGLGAGDLQGSETAIIPSSRHIFLPEGFQPGWIYQLTYLAGEALALDMGFVTISKLVSWMRHDQSPQNPLAGRVKQVIGWGRSQSGRAIRDFIWRGFNQDHAKRAVFDGMMPHISGAGKTTMNRFQNLVIAASRDFEDNLHPSDRFPFSYAQSEDHLTGQQDAILKRPLTDPKVIHTQSSAEYWHRRGSLVHTDTQGRDLAQPENVRIYLWSSSQHWSDPVPSLPPMGLCAQYQNVVLTVGLFRGSLLMMHRWLAEGIAPPESRIPMRADGTLVDMADLRFPNIPGVALPQGPNPLAWVDYGPNFDLGHAAPADPQKDESRHYAVLVPQVDQDGNDIAGIRVPMVQAPLGTYAGFNMRSPSMGAGALHGFSGSYIPFPETHYEAKRTRDPRRPIETRYKDSTAYLDDITKAATQLVAEGFFAPEEVEISAQAARNFGKANHLHSFSTVEGSKV